MIVFVCFLFACVLFFSFSTFLVVLFLFFCLFGFSFSIFFLNFYFILLFFFLWSLFLFLFSPFFLFFLFLLCLHNPSLCSIVVYTCIKTETSENVCYLLVQEDHFKKTVTV